MKISVSFAKISFYLLCILAFIIPIYIKFAAPVIILFIISTILEGDLKGHLEIIRKDNYLKFFISLYLFYLLGMLWSSNFTYGMKDLEVKLSFLVMPLFIIPHVLKMHQFNKIIVAFILGCLLSIFICFSHAFYKYFTTNEIYFFYEKLALFNHPGYLSMYITMAIGFLFYKLINEILNKIMVFIYIFFILLFWFSILMLQSKMAILFNISIWFPLIIIYYCIKSSNYLYLGVVSSLFIIICIFVYAFVLSGSSSRMPAMKTIIENKIDANTTESNLVRILIWKASLNIISNNLWVGVGTGDVKDKLLEEYKIRRMAGAINNKLNAHNQYLQTTVALGIFGFTILLLVFFVPIYYAFRTNNIIYLGFLILLAVNLLAESMFESQGGVIFYAFFNSLLYASHKNKLLADLA